MSWLSSWQDMRRTNKNFYKIHYLFNTKSKIKYRGEKSVRLSMTIDSPNVNGWKKWVRAQCCSTAPIVKYAHHIPLAYERYMHAWASATLISSCCCLRHNSPDLKHNVFSLLSLQGKPFFFFPLAVPQLAHDPLPCPEPYYGENSSGFCHCSSSVPL